MKKDSKKSKSISTMAPIHLVALVDIGLFALLSMVDGIFNPVILEIGVAMAVLVYIIHFILKILKMGDAYISTIVAMLASIGLVMQFRLSSEIGTKQFIWFLTGISIFLMVSALYPIIHKKIRSIWLIYSMIIALFIITQIFGVEISGAKNWIVIGGFSTQPSEFIKILFVFFMSSYATDKNSLTIKFKNTTIPSKWTLVVLVFTLLGFFAMQREFGTAVLIFMVYLSFLYVFEREILFTIGNAVVAGLGGLVAIKYVNHLQVRIDSWLDPFADVAGKGYQITQSLFAIGSGGFFGTGIGLGHPKYIPNVETDFIFSAICEETGIFGGIAVTLLFFLLVYRGIKISLRLRDQFTKALAFGLTITLGYQTFIIIGGVTKLIPLTGITLPFISYGGSSLVASYITLALLQSLSGPILREEVSVHEEVNDK